MKKRTLRELDLDELEERRVLVRVDYNVPLDEDGRVGDTTRIEATLPTLRYLLEAGARPVLLSHLGRPGGEVVPEMSLRPVATELERLIGVPVHFCSDITSDGALEASKNLPTGELLLLENTRFHPGERADEPEFATALSRLGDLYVNDAFGSTHRAHASVVGVTRHLRPAVAGLLVENELAALSRLRESADRPFVVAFGGAKIGDKLPLVELFVDRADTLLIGGALANTFLAAAGYETGESLVEDEAVTDARDVLDSPEIELRLPVDLVVGPPDGARDEIRIVAVDQIPPELAAYDIGPKTRHAFTEVIEAAATFFWNGPMGWFENPAFGDGTRAVATAAARAAESGAFCVIGGGDSARAIREAGLADRVSHVSTGGGASLEYLARGTLPGLEALDDA